MASTAPEDTMSEEIIAGFKDVNTYTQHALRTVLQATKCSNDLPSVGDDYDYYTSYQGVRDVLDIEGKRILHVMQNVLKHCSVKGNLTSSSDAVDVEDKFDVLMDANDQILERVGSWLDEASGVKKKEDTLVIATATPKQTTPIASWNKKKAGSSSSSNVAGFRLLAARNIQRPQLKFKDKIDNSNRPFVPRITVKPNAIASLEESLRLPDNVTVESIDDAEFVYPHPYQAELDSFKPTNRHLETEELKQPLPVLDTPVTLVTTTSQLATLIEKLRKENVIAVDLEHHSYRSFQGFLCLMQISTRTEDFIVDTLELRNDLFSLNEIFTDPNIVKVLHGAKSDIEWLQRDLGLYIVNMFDTGEAARVLGHSRFSLAHLLQNYCGVLADKQYQLADWRIRPLPEELIKYAREDTHYLLYIYNKMKKELIERGNEQKNLLLSVIHRSTEVCSKVFKKPIFKGDDYLDLYKKSKKLFNSQQLQALQQLYMWRDQLARQEDESTGYVLPNHMLLQIAEILPRERQGVFACCNPIPPLVRQFLPEIHSIIMDARETRLVKVSTPRRTRPSVSQHPMYDPENLLNCCHDLTYQQRKLDTLQESDTNIVKGSSRLFGEDGKCVVIKATPSLSAFGEKRKTKDHTSGERIAAALKASFVSPFCMYLPDNDTSTRLKPAQPVITESWKLRKNTVKRKERESTPNKTPSVSSEPPSKRQKIEMKDSVEQLMSLKQIKSKHKDISQRVGKSDGKSERKVTVKKDRIVTEITPYNYSAVDSKMFQGESSKRKHDVFDPLADSRGKKNKVSKPKLSSSSSQKSFTFSKGSKSGKTHSWPQK